MEVSVKKILLLCLIAFTASKADSWSFRRNQKYRHPWGEVSRYRVNDQSRYYPFSGGGVLDYQDVDMEDLIGAGTTCYEADNFAVNRKCDELLI